MNAYIAEKFRIVKAAKTRQNAVSVLTIDIWNHILESIKNDVGRRLIRWIKVPKLRSSTIESETLTTTFPYTCTVNIGFKNNRAKSKRIDVEVY